VKVDAFIKKPFSPNTLRNIVLQHDAKWAINCKL
jgi:hypothetical protein